MSKLEKIKQTARSLFWKHGFSRVTVEEICRESGVSKMTFYKHFRNKNELVMRLLDDVISGAIRRYREIMNSDRPFTEKVTEMIQLKMDQTRDMSNEFFKDYLDSGNPEMVAYLQEQMNVNIRMVVEDFMKAQEKGLIRQDIRIGFILYFINKMFAFAQDPELNSQYASTNELVMEMTRFFFYGVMEPATGKENSKR